MPVKLRLQRHGKKGKPFYHIVVADVRAPRDGKFIEKIGTYNPNTNPATIDISVDSALDWINKGAQPTDTVRAILSYKGVMYKKHLQRGVRKGAFSQEEADKRFEQWIQEKEGKIQGKVDKLTTAKAEAEKKRFEAEKAVNEERAKKLAAEASELTAAVEAEAAAENVETATEEAATEVPATEEVTAETPATEEKTEETTPAEESKEEAKEEDKPAAEAEADKAE